MTEEVIDDQKKTLDKWIEYFLYDEESKSYEMWEKYWVFQGLQNLGKYDKRKPVNLVKEIKQQYILFLQ